MNAYASFDILNSIFLNYLQYSITKSITIVMKYNSSLPQSMTGPLYTDRQNQKINNLAQSWATSTGGKHHLNPSKSKINVKTFLNKTGENFCLSHPNLENIRGSCYLGNPPKPSPSTHRDSYNQEKFPKNKRISQ